MLTFVQGTHFDRVTCLKPWFVNVSVKTNNFEMQDIYRYTALVRNLGFAFVLIKYLSLEKEKCYLFEETLIRELDMRAGSYPGEMNMGKTCYNMFLPCYNMLSC